jgi:ribosomal protein L29
MEVEMRFAKLRLETEMKLAMMKLRVEDDVIERVERERLRRLRTDIACLKTCTELQDLHAAFGRCREADIDGLGEMLDRELTRQRIVRPSPRSHLRMS